MKITGFRPQIITKDSSSSIDLFKDLGFEMRHEKTEIEGHDDYKNNTMKNPDGFSLHISEAANMPSDVVVLCINVDNFEEAVQFFEAHGFVNPSGSVVNTGSSKAAVMTSKQGLMINVVQHLK